MFTSFRNATIKSGIVLVKTENESKRCGIHFQITKTTG